MALSARLMLLFGYDSSAFTNKVKLVLRMKQIPYTYITVPSMMPRPLLRNTFGLTYRKIPVLAFGRDVYCDTSLIIEALEHHFPTTAGYGTVYPPANGWNYRPLARGFASFWTDRPFFRVICGLVPVSVWRSQFGVDRGGLIGHPLNAERLGQKIPENLAGVDTHLSMFETLLQGRCESGASRWIFPTESPSLADTSLYFMLRWGLNIADGKGVENLTGGELKEPDGVPASGSVTGEVFNEERYPGVWTWFHDFERWIYGLPNCESTPSSEREGQDSQWKDLLKSSKLLSDDNVLLPTPSSPLTELHAQTGMQKGQLVRVAPDDTGMNDPILGSLVAFGTEEVVVEPVEKADVDVRLHFPKVGFKYRTMEESKL